MAQDVQANKKVPMGNPKLGQSEMCTLFLQLNLKKITPDHGNLTRKWELCTENEYHINQKQGNLQEMTE